MRKKDSICSCTAAISSWILKIIWHIYSDPEKLRHPFWRAKAGLKKEHQIQCYMTLFSTLLEGKAPIKPSLHSICTNTLCPGATEGKSYFTSPLTSIFLLYSAFSFPFLLFYKLSLLLIGVTACPLYFILSSPSVTSQTQLLLVFSWVSQSCRTRDGASVPPSHLLSFSHHFIHYLTSMWVKWSISTCWIQQAPQEWLRSLSKENIHATVYFSKVYSGRKKKCPPASLDMSK